MTTWVRSVVTIGASVALLVGTAQGQGRVVTVSLAYGAPGNGPTPNFSPKGTQVPLVDVPQGVALPSGAVRPARVGTLQVGPDEHAWIKILVSADSDHPLDLCRLYLDRNRNGRFDDDGPPVVATPTQNDKTKAWWSSFAKTEFQVPYGTGTAEPYLASFWIVREGEAVPTIARFSVASWRTGTVEVDGVRALVAVMDANNDAIFDQHDMWSVLAATEPDAPKRVLTIAEARPMNRLMFLEVADKERVLEFRGISRDGRSLQFAVVDRATTKKADRAPDDALAPERTRPRAERPVVWEHGQAGFTAALGRARAGGLRVLLDFEASWCGPCKQMDEWIWTDQEVAAVLNARYIGVKLDGDIETALVDRFAIHGYPAGVILDASGHELGRFGDYKGSAAMLTFLATAPGRTR